MMARAALAAVTGLAAHLMAHHALGTPLLTDQIGEWIMARTPSSWALAILDSMGPWAKPFAATGGLAALGAVLNAVVFLQKHFGRLGPPLAALAITGWVPSGLTFWVPALAMLLLPAARSAVSGRRAALAMAAGTVMVAVEGRLRERRLATAAIPSTELYPFTPPASSFGDGLVRGAVTPAGEFYTMSKNTVDPSIDPAAWRLRILTDGVEIASWSYAEILDLPRTQRWATLRCISNTLHSNLMGTAHWSGVSLEQLVRRSAVPANAVELAVIGVDGHGDSLPIDYAFSSGVLFALGMNGKTLNRAHGYPLRLLCPRYYGLKNVKWIGELRFVTKPYIGTWPKLGYTKEPRPHVVSSIDRVRRDTGGIRVGGVSFAGDRGIQRVQVSVDRAEWVDAQMETPLSPYTWTRWTARVSSGAELRVRALDGTGLWQSETEGPLFPDGVKGPTVRKV